MEWEWKELNLAEPGSRNGNKELLEREGLGLKKTFPLISTVYVRMSVCLSVCLSSSPPSSSQPSHLFDCNYIVRSYFTKTVIN